MKLKAIVVTSIAALAAIAISGCSQTSLGGLQTEIDVIDACDKAEVTLESQDSSNKASKKIFVTENGKLSTDYLKALVRAETTIDPLLDCVLAPADSAEAKLYRGHVAISLLMAYGAYNFSIESYEERVGDAVTFLVHVQEAEKILRTASTALNEEVEDESFQQNQKRLERVLSVLEVALYAERPTLRRANTKVRSLIGAIATSHSVGVVQSAAEAAVDGLKKAIHIRHFGRAYLEDAIADMKRFSTDGAAQPQRVDWERRDKVIEVACAKVAAIAQLDDFKCIPDELE